MRIRISFTFIFFLLFHGLSFAAPDKQALPRKPNFVFILTDDQRFDSLACAGNTLIQTPNVDQLAAHGVRFRNNFVTTAICCVSRASILTGQYERRHGIGDFATGFSAEQWSQTYPALLRSAGYRTGFIGKFGVGNARYIAAKERDFDFWRGLPGQAGEWFIRPDDPRSKHTTARFGDQALEFIDGCSNSRPFCLSISFNAPHARDEKPRQFQPDPRDEKLYANVQIPVPETATVKHFQRLPEFVRMSEARRRWEKRFATEEMFQETMRDYFRLITGIDREVGRMIKRLSARGLTENTVIFFTSDNGWLAGEKGLADKWFMYEESIRVPLIIYDPRFSGSKQSHLVDAMSLNIDLAPTILEMAGLTIPRSMQGRSLKPWIEQENVTDWRKSFFYEHHFGPKIIPPTEGVRTERWAYLRWLPPNQEKEELYDLQRDPRQKTNLVESKSFAEVLTTLREEWSQSRMRLK